MDAAGLRSVTLFDALSDEDLARCAELLREDEFVAGSRLVKEGEFAYRFFVVLDGLVDVQHAFERVQQLGPGDFFGEVGVVTGQRRNASVLAHTRCHVASMMTWDFNALRQQFPELAARLDAVIAQRSSPPTP
jgi:CRP-like cAMP-binding protein